MLCFPSPDLADTIQCLDTNTLYYQTVRQIVPVAKGRWPKHKITQMFFNRTYTLCQIGMDSLQELRYRGRYYPDHFDTLHQIQMGVRDTGFPPWWGDLTIHTSHKAYLLRKLPEHYEQFNWDVPKNLPYQYPEFDKEASLLI